MRNSPYPTSQSLPDEVKDQLRQRLVAERAALLARPAVDVDDDAFALTATHGQGETELATRDIEFALASTRARADAASLAAIDAALVRFDDSTYGICESCRVEISLERLVALPDATRCMPCQRELIEAR